MEIKQNLWKPGFNQMSDYKILFPGAEILL